METPLELNPTLYDEATVAGILRDFRDRGYARLPGVFGRDSVDRFRAELLAAVTHDGLGHRVPDDSPFYLVGATAPRIRQVLVPALSHSQASPLPALYTSIWVIQPHTEPGAVPGWHKDREPDGMPGTEYHYAKDVFVGMYFEDMTEAGGPTRILAGSHRDVTMTPWTGQPDEPITCRKEDAYLLDQRAWHRGTPRTEPGTRALVVYGFYSVPLHYAFPERMPRVQRAAWHAARGRLDQAFFGGIFAPPGDDER